MTEPGAGYSGYKSLKEIIENPDLNFELTDHQIKSNGIILQGIRIIGNYAIIKGIHYTSWENATQIRSMLRIEPSLNDPFVYISEPGKMNNWTENAIKKELGINNANTEIKLTVIVPIERVWIKTSRNVAHYAITGILSQEIETLDIQRRKEL